MPSTQSFAILVVDDNELNLSLFRLFLHQLGHEVVAVSDPVEALSIAAEQSFDLIFTDIQMPGMSGIEAADRFRQNGYRGPIVAVTAHLSDAERQQIQDSEIASILIKPVTKNELTVTLAEYLNTSLPRGGQVQSEPPRYLEANPQEQPLIYDVALALHRAHNSASAAQEMLDLLLVSLDETVNELEAIEDSHGLQRVVHKALGGVRFTGAARLEATLEQLHANMSTIGASDAVKELNHEITKLKTWLKFNPTPWAD